MNNGTYKTEAGSTMTVYGKHGGKRIVDFDWVEEGGCIECEVDAYNSYEGDLVWHCDECGGGIAKLRKTNDP